VFGLLSNLAPANEQGATLGVAQSAGALARIVGPLFAASLYFHAPMLPYVICGAIAVVAAVLDSAVANAEHNNALSADDLYVKEARVDEGPTLKRWQFRAMGRVNRIRKRSSHITIAVEQREVRS
jgi:ribosomal protein L22